MFKRWEFGVAGLIVGLYLVAIFLGLRVRNFSALDSTAPKEKMAWAPPRQSSIPPGPQGDSIRSGALLFDQTPVYAPQYAPAKVSCSDCHAEGGIQPYASPMVGLPALFPMYNQRAGHVISLQDRIQECFVRSENGRPIPYDGPVMKALVDYINWLSLPQPNRRPFTGRGLVKLPEKQPDPQHGAAVYAEQCAGCHGEHGQGRPPLFPPLWGPYSFNDGAGMNSIAKMAPFVQHNMPQNRMGILSAQEAFDVAAFVHAQPRPAFNQAYKHF